MTLSFMRHAESRANNGEDVKSPNSDLSLNGIEQAKKVSGMFDLVVCSPMARAMSTFRHSQIRCTRTVIDKLCRERLVDNPTDFLQNEDVRPESGEPEDLHGHSDVLSRDLGKQPPVRCQERVTP